MWSKSILALTLIITIKCTYASSWQESVAAIPVGTTLVLRRQLTVHRGLDSVVLGENKLQAGFNRSIQSNNQQLGQPLPWLSWRYGNASATQQLNRMGETAEESYNDCKSRFRRHIKKAKRYESETRIESNKGLFRDGRIRTESTWDNDAWSYSEQLPHPCVAPTFTYATLLIDRRQSGGTFRRGYEFIVEDVSTYERQGEYFVDIALNSDIAHTLRIVSSHPASSIQLHQLIGRGLRNIGGGYFSLKKPETKYYE